MPKPASMTWAPTVAIEVFGTQLAGREEPTAGVGVGGVLVQGRQVLAGLEEPLQTEKVAVDALAVRRRPVMYSRCESMALRNSATRAALSAPGSAMALHHATEASLTERHVSVRPCWKRRVAADS